MIPHHRVKLSDLEIDRAGGLWWKNTQKNIFYSQKVWYTNQQKITNWINSGAVNNNSIYDPISNGMLLARDFFYHSEEYNEWRREVSHVNGTYLLIILAGNKWFV